MEVDMQFYLISRHEDSPRAYGLQSVTGTPDGITAIRWISCSGLSREILEQALEQARVGRAYILESMLEEIATKS